MAYDYSELVHLSQTWAAEALAAGWISTAAAQAFEHLDSRSPESLFDLSSGRPLLVAFMGGTGVGKSSLLNRLAGKAIAKTGVERPTSHEVTLYHHQRVVIPHLPEQLPVASVNTARHDDDGKQHIIWLDMPDFDSTEQHNKQLVLQWLPHIDVLIYVVSPERYRDEKAWRLLLAEGGRHAWLFVLNQWDRGDVAQLQDFKRQLGQAGFDDPVIFKTSCTDIAQADEFTELERMILSLAESHNIQQLQQSNLQARKNALKQVLQAQALELGAQQHAQALSSLWQSQWQTTAKLLAQGFNWPLQQLADYYARHAADLVGNPATSTQPVKAEIWDDWANARFNDGLDEFILAAGQLGIPALPIKHQLQPLRDKAANIMRTQTGVAARQALAMPGNWLQRGALKLLRIGEIILPLASIGWASYQVLTGYYQSSRQGVEAHYLGVDFAIHSTLLIALSWLLPFFMLKKLQPSIKNTALKGLQRGLTQGLAQIDAEVEQGLRNIREQHQQQLYLLAELASFCDAREPLPEVAEHSALKRVLLSHKK